MRSQRASNRQRKGEYLPAVVIIAVVSAIVTLLLMMSNQGTEVRSSPSPYPTLLPSPTETILTQLEVQEIMNLCGKEIRKNPPTDPRLTWNGNIIYDPFESAVGFTDHTLDFEKGKYEITAIGLGNGALSGKTEEVLCATLRKEAGHIAIFDPLVRSFESINGEAVLTTFREDGYPAEQAFFSLWDYLAFKNLPREDKELLIPKLVGNVPDATWDPWDGEITCELIMEAGYIMSIYVPSANFHWYIENQEELFGESCI